MQWRKRSAADILLPEIPGVSRRKPCDGRKATMDGNELLVPGSFDQCLSIKLFESRARIRCQVVRNPMASRSLTCQFHRYHPDVPQASSSLHTLPWRISDHCSYSNKMLLTTLCQIMIPIHLCTLKYAIPSWYGSKSEVDASPSWIMRMASSTRPSHTTSNNGQL